MKAFPPCNHSRQAAAGFFVQVLVFFFALIQGGSATFVSTQASLISSLGNYKTAGGGHTTKKNDAKCRQQTPPQEGFVGQSVEPAAWLR